MKKRRAHLITSVIFIIMIFSLSIATLKIDKKEFSDTENRFLKQAPTFDFDKLFNNNLTGEYDEYYNDQFVLRDKWIKLKVTADYLCGKKEDGGVYLSTDYLVEKIKDNGKGYGQKNIDGIIEFAKMYGKTANIYFMLIPSTSEIQSYKLPKYETSFNQSLFINNTYKKTDGYLKNIKIYDDLMAHKNEYIYYRTDHHWTTDGAYIAYEKMAKEMGFQAVAYDDLNIKIVSEDFKGSLNSKSGFDYVKPDTIKAVLNGNIAGFTVCNGHEDIQYKSIYFEDFLVKKDKYSYFMGRNEPKVVVCSKTESHRKLLIFKDSYAHCLVPLLSYNYGDITLIDMRYVNGDIDKLVDVSDYDDILFMYSMDVFLNTQNTSKLIGSLER